MTDYWHPFADMARQAPQKMVGNYVEGTNT